jgi:hypothetical protein
VSVGLIVLAVQGCGVRGGPTAPDSGPSSVISVKADAASYRAGATIAAAVVNGGSRPVYTEDQKADCTVVILQRRIGSGWTTLSACGSERASRTVSVAPGEILRASIDTAGVNFADQPVVRGEYRLVFSFRWAQQPEAGEDGRAESATFVIG